MKHERFWRDDTYMPGPTLQGHQECRFLIIGAGVAGLFTARELLRLGVSPRQVIIAEASTAGAGSTGYSAGMLVAELETEGNLGWNDLVRLRGHEVATTYRHACLAALQAVEQEIREEGIACDAQPGDFLILAKGRTGEWDLQSDAATRRSFGERPTLLSGRALAEEIAAEGFTLAERVHRGLSVNPLALAHGLALSLRRRGVRVFEHTKIQRRSNGVAFSKNGQIRYEQVVEATGTHASDASLHRYITTIAVTAPLSKTQVRGLRLEDRDLFIDETSDTSFHYGKITRDNRLLVGYGDKRTLWFGAQKRLYRPHLQEIRRFFSRAFRALPLPIDYAWSAAYALSTTPLPLCARIKDGMCVNGAGIQLGSIAAATHAAHRLLGTSHTSDIIWKT